jgi:hypothetical protein
LDRYRKRIAEEKRYLAEMKSFCLNYNPKGGDSIGEIVKFPVADGYAEYMVLKIKPLCLIHLPLNDAYEFQYAQNLTTKDILLSIKQEKDWGNYIKERLNTL